MERNEYIKFVNGKIYITEQRRIGTHETENLFEAREALKKELSAIIRQVKTLKTRADEINLILEKTKDK